MPAITLEQTQQMQEEEEKRQVENDLAPYFLSLFREGVPLQKEDLDEWRLQNVIPLKKILPVMKEAIEKGWVTKDAKGEMYITAAGKEIADRV